MTLLAELSRGKHDLVSKSEASSVQPPPPDSEPADPKTDTMQAPTDRKMASTPARQDTLQLRSSSPASARSRLERDETSSVVSAMTARSSQGTSKRRQCHVCQRDHSTSPLFRCSSCPRSYHGRCHSGGVPVSAAADWQCCRCVKKGVPPPESRKLTASVANEGSVGMAPANAVKVVATSVKRHTPHPSSSTSHQIHTQPATPAAKAQSENGEEHIERRKSSSNEEASTTGSKEAQTERVDVPTSLQVAEVPTSLDASSHSFAEVNKVPSASSQPIQVDGILHDYKSLDGTRAAAEATADTEAVDQEARSLREFEIPESPDLVRGSLANITNPDIAVAPGDSGFIKQAQTAGDTAGPTHMQAQPPTDGAVDADARRHKIKLRPSWALKSSRSNLNTVPCSECGRLTDRKPGVTSQRCSRCRSSRSTQQSPAPGGGNSDLPLSVTWPADGQKSEQATDTAVLQSSRLLKEDIDSRGSQHPGSNLSHVAQNEHDVHSASSTTSGQTPDEPQPWELPSTVVGSKQTACDYCRRRHRKCKHPHDQDVPSPATAFRLGQGPGEERTDGIMGEVDRSSSGHVTDGAAAAINTQAAAADPSTPHTSAHEFATVNAHSDSASELLSAGHLTDRDPFREATSEKDLGDWETRPKGTYTNLCAMALHAANGRPLAPKEVVLWIAQNVPGYDPKRGRWAASIGATLAAIRSGGPTAPKRSLWKRNTPGLQPTDAGTYELLPEMADRIMHWDHVRREPILPSERDEARSGGDAAKRCQPDISAESDGSITAAEGEDVPANLGDCKTTVDSIGCDEHITPTEGEDAQTTVDEPKATADPMDCDEHLVSIEGQNKKRENDDPPGSDFRPAYHKWKRPRALVDSDDEFAIDGTTAAPDATARPREGPPNKRLRIDYTATRLLDDANSVLKDVPMVDEAAGASSETAQRAAKKSAPTQKAPKKGIAAQSVELPSITLNDAAQPPSSYRDATRDDMLPQTYPHRIVETDLIVQAKQARGVPRPDDFSALHLYEEWPEYDPVNSFDKDARIAEIKARPNRKQRMRQPLKMPHLDSFIRATGEKGNPTEASFDDQAVSKTWAGSCAVEISAVDMLSQASAEANVNIRAFDHPDEFFGIPNKPIPIIHQGELAFRDGTRNEKGELPRGRLVYKVGYAPM